MDLGLSNDYFQKDTPENRATLKLYQDYIEQILGYANVSNPAAKAKAIVAYEKRLQKRCLPMRKIVTYKNATTQSI